MAAEGKLRHLFDTFASSGSDGISPYDQDRLMLRYSHWVVRFVEEFQIVKPVCVVIQVID